MNKVIIVHYTEDQAAVDAFKAQVEHLWYQHVDYTRNLIISTLGSLEDTVAVIDRLMKNQEDIGNAVSPYYGEEAASVVIGLLKNHITLVADIVKNIKDATGTAELEAAAAANADSIATFLDSADPDNWPKAVVFDILARHLECTLNQANARFAKDWVTDFDTYDACKRNIEQLATAMSCGIVDKFPESFVMKYSSKTIKKN